VKSIEKLLIRVQREKMDSSNQVTNAFSARRRPNDDGFTEDEDEGHKKSKGIKFGDRVTYLTRALVKNNIVG
jgi:hypothetical protein